MSNYTNIVSIAIHAKLKGLGTSQNSSFVHPWSLGCAFVPLQESLNYIPYEIPEKKTICNNNFGLKS